MVSLEKISLAKQGDFSNIPLRDLVCELKWTKDIDLDFYAFYVMDETQQKEGFLSKLFGSSKSVNEKKVKYINFSNMGSLRKYPFISLDQDSGVGDVGGNNVETLRFASLKEHEEILIVANIFGKRNAVFSSYDGKVVLTADNKEYEVPLTSSEKGNFCVVAKIKKVDGKHRLINVNKTCTSKNKVMEIFG